MTIYSPYILLLPYNFTGFFNTFPKLCPFFFFFRTLARQLWLWLSLLILTVFLNCTFLEIVPTFLETLNIPNSPNLLYSGQNEALHSKPFDFAEKTNFALRHDTQVLRNTQTNVQHSLTLYKNLLLAINQVSFYSSMSITVYNINRGVQDTVFFNCLHTKSSLVTQFLKPDTQTPEPHTKSAKPYTNSRPSTQFSISWNSFCKTQHTILYETKIWFKEVSWFPFSNTIVSVQLHVFLFFRTV